MQILKNARLVHQEHSLIRPGNLVLSVPTEHTIFHQEMDASNAHKILHMIIEHKLAMHAKQGPHITLRQAYAMCSAVMQAFTIA